MNKFGTISSCVNIRTRFGCVFLRHCFVKILANASALAPFLPRIDAKTQHQNSMNLKQDKIDCFSRPTTKKNGYFTCFRRVRILTQLLKQKQSLLTRGFLNLVDRLLNI